MLQYFSDHKKGQQWKKLYVKTLLIIRKNQISLVKYLQNILHLMKANENGNGKKATNISTESLKRGYQRLICSGYHWIVGNEEDQELSEKGNFTLSYVTRLLYVKTLHTPMHALKDRWGWELKCCNFPFDSMWKMVCGKKYPVERKWMKDMHE